MTRGFGHYALHGFVLIACGTVVFTACGTHIEREKNGDKPKRVDIESPLGSLHLSADVDPKQTGLQVYPGSRPRHDRDADSVNMSLFGMKVVVASFETDDSPDKVLGFYNGQLKHFGSVLECRAEGHGFSVPRHNSNNEEAGCEHGEAADAAALARSSGVELKAGNKQDQHIVAIQPRGKGTVYALVYLRHGSKDTI